MSEKKVIVRQVKSAIGRDKRFRARLAALGLGRIGKQKEFVSSSALKGALESVKYVIEVYEAK